MGEIPQELQALYDLILPLNMRVEPVVKSKEPDREEKFEAVNILPEEAKAFFQWAKDMRFGTSRDERVHKTEAIVKWCWHIAETAKAQRKLNDREYFLRRSKVDKTTEHKKMAEDKVLIARLFETKFPKDAAIATEFAAMTAKDAKEAANKKTEETAQTKTEGSAENSEVRA